MAANTNAIQQSLCNSTRDLLESNNNNTRAILDFLTQEKVELLFSHINSYVRESNKNKTPYDLMVERFGIEFMGLLVLSEFHPKIFVLNQAF